MAARRRSGAAPSAPPPPPQLQHTVHDGSATACCHVVLRQFVLTQQDAWQGFARLHNLDGPLLGLMSVATAQEAR